MENRSATQITTGKKQMSFNMIDDIYIHATTPLTLFIGAVYKFAYLLIESRTM